MKTIYLVRHGESTVNTDKEHFHGFDAPLTELGIEQANYVSERASRLQFDALVASPMLRTKVTAEMIAAETGHQIEFNDDFREWHLPTSLNGRRRKDPAVDEVAQKAWAARNGTIGEKIEDSENFAELCERAARTLKFLESHEANRILVVGHGYFTRVLIARMLYGEDLTPQIFEPLIWGMRTRNTGISVLQYDPNDPERSWWLLVFNDHAHLG